MSVERRLLAMLRPVRRDAILGVVLAAATLVVGIALIATATYLISRAAQVTMFVEVAVLVAAVRAFAIGRAALRYAERYVTHRTTLGLLATLRAAAFRALVPRLPALATSSSTGDLLARLGPDIDAMDRSYLVGVVPVVAASVAGIVAVVGLGLVAPELGFVLAVGLIAGGVLSPGLTRLLTRPAAAQLVTDRAGLHAAIADDLAGTAELLAFGATTGFDDRSGRAAGALRRLEAREGWLRGAADGVATAASGLTALIVLALAIPLVTAGVLDPTLLAVLPLVALAAFDGIGPIATSVDQREESRAAAGRVFELTDAPVPVQEPATPATLPGRGDVAVEGLAFRYEPGAVPVFADLTFTVPEGDRLAISGPSGSGKSTLVDLLVRFLEPEAGRIRVGGVDLATVSGDAARARMAVVPQRPYLFHGTLRDNLLVARGDATDDAIEEALDVAGLGHIVADTPNGLDTLVGEDGMRLSGGERRRIAIARMVLKDAPIVILDEATAHLDPATEDRLAARLDAYLRGRTAIILAHRSALLDLAPTRLELPPSGERD